MYYRVQPKARPLAHRSRTSNGDLLPPGYVFGYTSAQELLSGLLEWGFDGHDPEELEVVTFRGVGAYDPGDAEGVAVRPTREVRREPLVTFIRRQRTYAQRRWRGGVDPATKRAVLEQVAEAFAGERDNLVVAHDTVRDDRRSRG